MSQDAKLQPWRFGAVLIVGNCVEGKLGLESAMVFSSEPQPPAKYH
jgi:hypothetical protein